MKSTLFESEANDIDRCLARISLDLGPRVKVDGDSCKVVFGVRDVHLTHPDQSALVCHVDYQVSVARAAPSGECAREMMQPFAVNVGWSRARTLLPRMLAVREEVRKILLLEFAESEAL